MHSQQNIKKSFSVSTPSLCHIWPGHSDIS